MTVCLSGAALVSVETTCPKRDTTGLESTSAPQCWVSLSQLHLNKKLELDDILIVYGCCDIILNLGFLIM